MSFHSFWCHSIHSNLISSFRCHSIHSNVIPLIPMSFHSFWCHSTHSEVIPFILTSFHHSDVIPFIPISFHHSDVILVILMSFQSFWVVWDDLGMTLFRNDENDLGMPISLIPGSFWSSCAIPDDREKMAFFHSHPCHSDVIPSFEHHSEIWNNWNEVEMTNNLRPK